MYRSAYNRIVQDIGIIGLANVGNSISGILLLPLLTKALGVQEYGLYVQFTVTIFLAMTFATLGLPYATVRFLSGEKDKNKIQDDVYSTFTLITLFSAFVGFFFLLLAGLISEILFDGIIELVYILAILIPIESLIGSSVNLLRAFHQTKNYATVSLTRTYLELVAIYFVVVNGYGIVYVAITVLILRTMLLIILISSLVRSIGVKRPNFSRIDEYLHFGLPTVPGNLAAWIVGSSDRYIIGILMGATFVGYYNPGYSLGSMIAMLVTPINFVLVSVLAKYYDENEIDLVRNIFHFSLKYFLILAIPAFIGISLLSRPILELLTTEDIASKSYLVTPFIALSMLLYSVSSVTMNVSLYLAKKARLLMLNYCILSWINLLLNLALIPKWGIIGAAISTTVAYAIGFIYSAYFSMRFFEFYWDLKSIGKIIISSTIMAIFVILFYPQNLHQIFITLVVSAILYFASLIAIKGINDEEILFFKSLNKRSQIIGH